MNTPYLIAALFFFAVVVIIQIIRMNGYILKISKSSELNQTEIKEEKNWEFIKGLY